MGRGWTHDGLHLIFALILAAAYGNAAYRRDDPK
jgi:hypothetical protein